MMKIEKVAMYHLRMPLKEPFETSFGRIETRDSILIEVYADGLIGYGECVADKDPGYSYETSDTAWYILENFIVPTMLGRKLASVKDFSEQVSFIKGHLMAKAGFELALWDVFGKARNESLKKMIGGQKQSVAVGVSIGIQRNPEELVKRASAYIKDGYKRIKIKIKPGRDIHDVQAMRDAYPDCLLQVDANSAYLPNDISTLQILDETNLLMIEQPFAEDDLWDHSKLQQQLKTPICLDESIRSLQHARKAIEMDSCQVINIKAGRVGGIAESVKIHDYCKKKNIPVWCGGMLETGVGRAANLALASLAGFKFPGDISATNRYYDVDITNEEFVLNNNDSTIDVPDSSGLGVTINWEHVKRFLLRQEQDF